MSLMWSTNQHQYFTCDGAKAFPCAPGPDSHYTDWLEICPIVKGRVQLTKIDALKGKGRNYRCPLGIAPGVLSACKGSWCMPVACHRDVLSAFRAI